METKVHPIVETGAIFRADQLIAESTGKRETSANRGSTEKFDNDIRSADL